MTFESALAGYATALLWANAICGVETCEDGRRSGECTHTMSAYGRFGLSSFSERDRATMRADLRAFIDASPEDFAAYCQVRSADDYGHDLALTRNGHGTGFWDRGLGDLGDRLAERARGMGEAYACIYADRPSLDI